jgi:hypothetical protein
VVLHGHTGACMYVCMHEYVYVGVYLCMYLYMYTFVHMYVRIYVRTRVCTTIYICMHHIHTYLRNFRVSVIVLWMATRLSIPRIPQ